MRPLSPRRPSGGSPPLAALRGSASLLGSAALLAIVALAGCGTSTPSTGARSPTAAARVAAATTPAAPQPGVDLSPIRGKTPRLKPVPDPPRLRDCSRRSTHKGAVDEEAAQSFALHLSDALRASNFTQDFAEMWFGASKPWVHIGMRRHAYDGLIKRCAKQLRLGGLVEIDSRRFSFHELSRASDRFVDSLEDLYKDLLLESDGGAVDYVNVTVSPDITAAQMRRVRKVARATGVAFQFSLGPIYAAEPA